MNTHHYCLFCRANTELECFCVSSQIEVLLERERDFIDAKYKVVVDDYNKLNDKYKELVKEYDVLRDEVKLLRDELEGTNHLSADPSEWGLRAMFSGVVEQRDNFEKQRDELLSQVRFLQEASGLDIRFGTK